MKTKCFFFRVRFVEAKHWIWSCATCGAEWYCCVADVKIFAVISGFYRPRGELKKTSNAQVQHSETITLANETFHIALCREPTRSHYSQLAGARDKYENVIYNSSACGWECHEICVRKIYINTSNTHDDVFVFVCYTCEQCIRGTFCGRRCYNHLIFNSQFSHNISLDSNSSSLAFT